LNELLKQTGNPGVWKSSEVALASAVDLCRGATISAVEEDEDVPLRLLASDIAHEIKVYMRVTSKKVHPCLLMSYC
jgi:neurofibromin 1